MIESIHIDIKRKQYGNGLLVIKDMQMSANLAELIAIVGPSGAGKTTLLKIISGLDRQIIGRITVNKDAKPLWALSPKIGFVFQEPRLMPWMTARENIELAVAATEVDRTEVSSLLQQVGLAGFESSYPAQLSGGMQRRVSLARAFAISPALLMLDEPFQSLDEPTADGLRRLLLDLWRIRQPIVFFVTHQLREALAIADRVVFVSQRPSNIILDYSVPLERPREINGAAVNALYNDLLKKHPSLLSGVVR